MIYHTIYMYLFTLRITVLAVYENVVKGITFQYQMTATSANQERMSYHVTRIYHIR